MERLTKRLSNGEVIHNCGKCPKVNEKDFCSEKNCEAVILNHLAELEDKLESEELIPKNKVMEKIESIIDELVEIGFMDSQCQVADCHKPYSIQCGEGVCIEENQKIWKDKILEALK